MFPVHGAGFKWGLVRMARTPTTLTLTLTLGLTSSASSAGVLVSAILGSAAASRPPVATSRPPIPSASTISTEGCYDLLDRYILPIDRKYLLLLRIEGGVWYCRLGLVHVDCGGGY